jgi:sarcosine oxidase gamma subunit
VTHRKWSNAVTIALVGPDEWVVIDTTQAASWAMIEDWPLEEAPALDRALSVCADVISGKRTPEDARRAFIEAVKEAGIPMKEG